MWLASFPKSGNTWLRVFLANYLFGGEEPVSINDLDRHSAGDADIRNYLPFLEGASAPYSDEDVYAVREQAQRRMAEVSDGVAFVKTHNRFANYCKAPTICPDVTAGAIYVVRNPLDVVPSYAKHYGIPLDQAISATSASSLKLPATEHMITIDVGSWSDHVTSWVQDRGVYMLVLRYEAMLHAPERTFSEIVNYLRVPMDVDRLKRSIEFSSFDKLAAQEKAKGFGENSPDGTEGFFRKGQSGGWRDVLTNEQAKEIIRAHGPVMRKFRYLNDRGEPTI